MCLFLRKWAEAKTSWFVITSFLSQAPKPLDPIFPILQPESILITPISFKLCMYSLIQFLTLTLWHDHHSFPILNICINDVTSILLINTSQHICPPFVEDISSSTYLILLFVWGELLPGAQLSLDGSTQTHTHTHNFLCRRASSYYIIYKIR